MTNNIIQIVESMVAKEKKHLNKLKTLRFFFVDQDSFIKKSEATLKHLEGRLIEYVQSK